MRSSSALFWSLVLCGGATVLVGAEYHVAPDGSDASGRSGAVDQPFATIAHAVRQARQPGDTVTVAEGTYRNEFIVFRASGEPGAPITLRGAPGARVVVKGSTPVPADAWHQDAPGRWSAPWDKRFGAFDPRLADADPSNDPDVSRNRGRLFPRNRFFVDGRCLREYPTVEAMDDEGFCLTKTDGRVHMTLSDGTRPSDHWVEGTTQELPLLATWGHSHLTIRNLTFEHLANGTQGAAAVRVAGPFGGVKGLGPVPGGTNACVVVEDVAVRGVAGFGMSVGGSQHVVRRCVLDDNGQGGLHVSNARECRFEQVAWRRNNRHPGKEFDRGWEAVMKVAASRDCIFERCESADNHGMGFWVDGPYNVGNQLLNSRVVSNSLQGVRLEVSFGTTVANCLLVGNRQNQIEISASAGNRILHNTIVGGFEGALGIGVLAPFGSTNAMSSYGNLVLNNIVVDNQRNRYGKSWMVPTVVTNTAGCLPVRRGASPPYADNHSDYNLFWLSSEPQGEREVFIGKGGRFKTLDAFRAASGQEANSLWADPLFVDASVGNYRLRAESPACGVGSEEAMAWVPRDASGMLRSSERIDVGAWQTEAGRSVEPTIPKSRRSGEPLVPR